MRKSVYRGKDSETGDWIYGNYFYCRHSLSHFILTNLFFDADVSDLTLVEWHEVEGGTVGQSIGHKDLTGRDLYEDDIVEDIKGRRMMVVWNDDGWQFKAMAKTNFIYAPIRLWFSSTRPAPTLIGNAWDNPEM